MEMEVRGIKIGCREAPTHLITATESERVDGASLVSEVTKIFILLTERGKTKNLDF